MTHIDTPTYTQDTTKKQKENSRQTSSVAYFFQVLTIIIPLICVITEILVYKHVLNVYAPEIIVRFAALEFVCIVIFALLHRNRKIS